MSKKVIVSKFEVLSKNFRGRTEESHEKLGITGLRAEIFVSLLVPYCYCHQEHHHHNYSC
jgi:hypothetical protein